MAPPELDPLTLRRARAGDRDACKALVLRYQNLVAHTASRVLGRGAPELDDVAQDAMLKVLHGLPGFEPDGAARLSTWVATVTARTAVDALRVRRNVVPLDALRDARDDAKDPAERLDDAQERERLARAMERLAPEQRAALVLRVEHDMDYDQIARSLGVEAGTVKSRLARAKQALMAALGARDAGADHGRA